ncbi:MAG: BON domain-containing protein [Gammaproteobacteria bacterium]|jgi:osmotically-inducible protein OsmY|nr:BON domain-containing protein [Gammaproteobacteria bacterium]
MLKVNFHKTTAIIGLLAVISFLHGCAAVVVGAAASSAVVAQDRRTAGTIIEDKSIQLKAIQAIYEVAEDDPAIHVAAISYNNRVLLVGQVPSRNIRYEIEKSVKDVEKIRQVHNEILIKAPTSMLQRSNDSWITTKIKGEMAVTKDLNPTRVKVITEDGTVYLMGIVTPLEEEITVDIARHTKGVQRVVKIFEYEK